MKRNFYGPAIAFVLLARAAMAGGVCSTNVSGPRNDFQFFAGYSPGTSHVFGTAEDRQLAVAGFTYGYRCWTLGSTSVYSTASIIPAFILRQPAQTVATTSPFFVRRIGPHPVYGFAVAPIGFRFEFADRRPVHPFLETMGGIVASTEPIPEEGPNATGLNFFFDFGGGIRWDYSPRRAISFGYRFLHVSNADTTSFNPGVDNNVIYVAYSFRL